MPTTGSLGVKEVVIPPRRAARGAGGIALRPRSEPRGDEV